MTSTATHASRRPARWSASGGCPRPGLLGSRVERPVNDIDMYDAKQLRLGGRMRVPR